MNLLKLLIITTTLSALGGCKHPGIRTMSMAERDGLANNSFVPKNAFIRHLGAKALWQNDLSSPTRSVLIEQKEGLQYFTLKEEPSGTVLDEFDFIIRDIRYFTKKGEPYPRISFAAERREIFTYYTEVNKGTLFYFVKDLE